jgi:sterol desaturase/sphingolipid hydroxylase (fatty acid hydroxylase superfamily)
VHKQVWSTTFERFPTGTFPIVGPIALDVHDWGRPQDGSPRMFGQSFLEWFTCAHPRSLITAYLPGGLILLALGLRTGMSIAGTAAWYVVGLALWTFLEYVIHRFSFHLTPHNRLQVIFGYLIHGVHHAYPEDSRRWVMPLVVTLPVGGMILGLLWLGLGTPALPAFAGVMHGYLAYDTLHYAIHNRSMRSRLGRYLRNFHLQHHYVSPERNFGESSPFWDFVFRTTR